MKETKCEMCGRPNGPTSLICHGACGEAWEEMHGGPEPGPEDD